MKALNTYVNEWRASLNTVSSIKKIQYFIHKLTTNEQIKIFDKDWPQINEYKDKVYIDDEHVELGDDGWTIKEYKQGTYKVYIEDIDNVTDCKYMFYRCVTLVEIPLFDTSKVENMDAMFYDCVNLLNAPLFDTSNVIDCQYMFFDCQNIKTVPKFNTKNCKSFNELFCNCYQLKEVPLFDTNKVEDMSLMFYGCNNLSDETKQEWSQIYNFETHNKKQ